MASRKVVRKKESPEEVAKYLLKENMTVEAYTEIQNRRKDRLAFWNKIGVKALIENEQTLIEFGEEVLKHMQKK